MKPKTKPLLVFYILLAYILAQFGWWTYHIYDLNKTIHSQQQHLIEHTTTNSAKIAELKTQLDKDLDKRFWMVLGEGGVFFVLLLLGGYYTRKAFKKEEEAVKQQNNFLMSVTHELKTPVASTKLTLETLLRNTEKGPQSRIIGTGEKTILAKAINETNRLNALVDNMLTATQLQTANYTLQKEKGDLADFIQDLLNAPVFASQGRIKGEIQPDITFHFDKLAMQSILSNLVENALKYSPTEAHVSVKLKQENDIISLFVADNGVGIPKEESAKIFNRFYRIGNEETRTTKGTGLGLFIVKYLVEMHGGTVAVEPNEPKGSMFKITFEA